MKKLFTIAMLLLAGLIANAQEGKWTTGINDADELKGQTGGPYYLYEVKGIGSFVVWDWDDWVFKINSDNGYYDVWYYQSNGFRYMRVTIGLYTMDNKLVESRDVELAADVSQRSGWINRNGMYYPATRKKLRKMIRALKSGEGYVRVVCSRKGAPEFDLKIMPYTEPSEAKQD